MHPHKKAISKAKLRSRSRIGQQPKRFTQLSCFKNICPRMNRTMKMIDMLDIAIASPLRPFCPQRDAISGILDH